MLPVQLGMVAAVVLLVWASIGLHLRQERALMEDSAWSDSGNLARGFGESIARTVEAVDQVMLTIRAVFRNDPERFDIAALAPRADLLNELTLQISITDIRGIMHGSNIDPTTRVDLSDREHIRAQLDTATDDLFISRPVLGRVSNKWSIQFTRKLFDRSGALAGVVIISLDPTYFARFYQSLDIGNGSISLVGRDGVIRARAPSVPSAVGVHVPPDVLNRIDGPEASGIYREASAIDGVERLYSYRRLDRYPLAVIVGLSAAEVFGPYHRDVMQYGIVGTALTLLVLLIGAVLIRQARAQALMQRSLHATLANISQGILKLDANKRIRVINQRAIELLCLPPELTRVGVPFSDILHWQLARGEFDGYSDVDVVGLARSGGLGPEFYERTRRDGTVLEIRTQRLPHGGAVRTYTNITDRKANEQALSSALEAARSAQSAQSDFLAMMSHEIRTPINGVIGMAGLLMDSELSATQRRFTATLRDAADSLMHIIDDILDFSKLDAQRMDLEEVALDLRSVVDSAVDLLRVNATEKNLYLRSHIASGTPVFLLGDPGRLRQILLNLISNAVKFTAKGGVTVEVGGVIIDGDEAQIEIAVRDTGIGIPIEAQSRLFERFYQVDRSTSREFGGTGLGLAISARLAEQMGGRIEVDNAPGQPGQGSVFRVTLVFARAPATLQRPDVDEQTAALVARPALRQQLRVLLAEDNATNRLVAVTRLEMLGHRVDAVMTGTEAVAAMQNTAYDLVLMDVMMPEMDGLAATRAIRAMSGAAAEVPIVALTANVFRHHQDECLAAGMDDFLGKPFLPAQLARVIERAMSGHLRPLQANERADDASARQSLIEALGEVEADAVMNAFVQEARGRIGDIELLFDGNEHGACALACRSLSETAYSVGFSRLGGVADAASRRPGPEVHRLNAVLEDTLARQEPRAGAAG